tara:strand:- start:51293 stop:52171 length:879 start_codon:yes stop_codon:yes gene_type:complete
LTKEQLSDPHKLDIKTLEHKIKDLADVFEITKFDLYGGEFAVLPLSYQNDVVSVLQHYARDKVNIITNLTKLSDIFFDEALDISVSFDFSAREQHELVLKNIGFLNRPISILMLASPDLMKLDHEMMIQTFNIFRNIISVEIKPYSTNQANALSTKFSSFEEFVKKWISAKTKKNFSFENENRIQKSLKRSYSAFSDDHIYITPSGKYAVLEFDKADNEFFLELNSIEDYLNWCQQEPNKLTPICQSCEYLGNCLTEHYRQVKSLENSCNGFKFLLDWYRNEKMENKSADLS